MIQLPGKKTIIVDILKNWHKRLVMNSVRQKGQLALLCTLSSRLSRVSFQAYIKPAWLDVRRQTSEISAREILQPRVTARTSPQRWPTISSSDLAPLSLALGAFDTSDGFCVP